jgi:hypothetical protein
VDFAGGVQLLGYELPAAAQPGETLMLTTYWLLGQVAATDRANDLAFFHHVEDDQGHIIGQHDGVGVPSSVWRPGDLLIERHALHISLAAAPGNYRVLAGVYGRRGGRRMPVHQHTDDAVLLGQLSIGPDGSQPVASFGAPGS